MITYQNEKCTNVREIMDYCLAAPVRDPAFSEIGKHFENCLSCRSEWEKREKFKERIKSAVMREAAAPQSLFDSIRRQIRESR